MLPYLLILVSVAACSVKNMFIKVESRYMHGWRLFFAENFILALSAMLLMGLTLLFRVHFSASVLICGSLFGLLMILFFVCYTLAVQRGSLAITSLISALGFLISSFFGSIYGHQTIPALRYVGVCLIVIALFITLEKDKEQKKFSFAWLLLAFCTMLISGGFGIIQYLFNAINGGSYSRDMMFTCFGAMSLVSGLLTLCTKPVSKGDASGANSGTASEEGRMTTGLSKSDRLKFIGNAVIIGITCCLQNLMNLITAGLLPSMVAFPLSCCAPVITTALLSCLIFKEKISMRKAIGFVLCFAGMILVGVA